MSIWWCWWRCVSFIRKLEYQCFWSILVPTRKPQASTLHHAIFAAPVRTKNSELVTLWLQFRQRACTSCDVLHTYMWYSLYSTNEPVFKWFCTKLQVFSSHWILNTISSSWSSWLLWRWSSLLLLVMFIAHTVFHVNDFKNNFWVHSLWGQWRWR